MSYVIVLIVRYGMDMVCMMLTSNLRTCTDTTFDFETKAFGLCTYIHIWGRPVDKPKREEACD